MSPVRLWATAVLSVFLPAAGAAAGERITLPQADGSKLELAEPATRLITLAPHLAELAFDAGAGDRLLATVEYSDYPAAAASLPRIGDAFRFDLERIVALQPDLVLAWASGNPSAALSRLEALGLPVWRTEVRQPEDIADLLESIASAVGAAAPAAAREARNRLAELRLSHRGSSEVSYFYQVAEKPLFTLNGAHLVSQGLAICGGRNVFAGEPVLAPQVTREAVLLADPEALIAPVLPGQPDPLAHWRAWPRLRAVSTDALIHLSADAISRATARTLDSFVHACNELERVRQARREESE